jgi:transposase
MLTRIDALDADIADVETQIAPFARAVARLDEIPGVGATAAVVIIAEVGVDMARFPTPAHLASWARFAPGVKESAGRKKGTGSTGHGDRYLARVLGEAAVGASRTNTFLGERYRRIARRRGKKKAVVAVGCSILVIVWYLLQDDAIQFHDHDHDLGPGYYDSRINPERKKAQPHPRTRSPRLPRHPATRCLTTQHRPHRFNPSQLRFAPPGRYRTPTHHPFSS